MALHLADLVDQEGVHGSRRAKQLLLEHRQEAICLHAITTDQNG
jgi:hypothetical protein